MKKEAETNQNLYVLCGSGGVLGVGGWGGGENMYWLSVRHCVNTHLLNNLATAKSACD